MGEGRGCSPQCHGNQPPESSPSPQQTHFPASLSMIFHQELQLESALAAVQRHRWGFDSSETSTDKRRCVSVHRKALPALIAVRGVGCRGACCTLHGLISQW